MAHSIFKPKEKYIMENNQKFEYSSIIITGILIIAALLAGYWIMNFIKEAPTPSSATPSQVKIDETSYKKINESKDYGNVVTPSEAGYGRVNPFSPYK